MIEIDGVAYPRVSEILTATGLGWTGWSQGPSRERAAALGTAVHKACELDAAGRLDEASVHPEVRPGLDGYRAFVRETQHKAIASEHRLLHPAWGYVGHLDRVGTLGRLPTVLIDWKFTDHPDLWAARFQLAAYWRLWNDTHPEAPVSSVFVVQLRKNGTFALHDLTAEAQAAEQTFFAAVLVWKALQERETRGGR